MAIANRSNHHQAWPVSGISSPRRERTVATWYDMINGATRRRMITIVGEDGSIHVRGLAPFLCMCSSLDLVCLVAFDDDIHPRLNSVIISRWHRKYCYLLIPVCAPKWIISTQKTTQSIWPLDYVYWATRAHIIIWVGILFCPGIDKHRMGNSLISLGSLGNNKML